MKAPFRVDAASRGPAECGAFAAIREISGSMGVRGGGRSLDRTRLIPAGREIPITMGIYSAESRDSAALRPEALEMSSKINAQ
jgi:hypothetical protein